MISDVSVFVDVFGDVVADVQDQYDAVNGEKPYYEYGHPRDINKVLTMKDRSAIDKFKKWPLIALILDLTESSGDIKYKYTVSPRVLILATTDKNYVSKQRVEKTFKPTLYPIYNLLLDSISNSGYFDVSGVDGIEKEKTDRLYWGSEGIYGSEGLIFNQHLDAIDIQFNNLSVFQKNNC